VTNLNIIDGLITAGLVAGGIALTGLALLVAALIAGAGYRAATAIAIHWHARSLVRHLELYVRHPALRAALDTNYQPRKEDTP
jgi:hypothetical protein